MRVKLFLMLLLLFVVFPAIPSLGQEGQEMPGNSNAEAKAAGTVGIRWLGQASFLITTPDGTKIMIDPANFKGYHTPAGMTADIVTISHEHVDHNVVPEMPKTPLVLHGTNEKCTVVNKIDTNIGPVHIHSVASFHNPAKDRTNAIFVYEFGGVRIAHLGDIGTILSDEQIKAIGEIDILMIPVGGYYTIDPIMADSIVSQLKVKRYILPMHYKTEAFDGLPYSAEDFIKGRKNVIRSDSSELTFKSEERPEAMEYVVLRY
jgi:L-ascorbate metabolism protein UlaG (beta-lactamase superfamily)